MRLARIALAKDDVNLASPVEVTWPDFWRLTCGSRAVTDMSGRL
jgi:hypothetical protein